MQDLLISLWEQTSCTILFVTHDIGEAIVLADRILILDTCPGRVCEDVVVSLDRPRDRDKQEFYPYKRRLQQEIEYIRCCKREEGLQ